MCLRGGGSVGKGEDVGREMEGSSPTQAQILLFITDI